MYSPDAPPSSDPKKPTAAAAILAKLHAHTLRFGLHWVANGDLMDAGGGDWRRRVFELRQRGHVIIMKRDTKNAHLTFWAWLGVERESKAEAEYQKMEHRPNDPPVQIAWRTNISTGGNETTYRYETSDRISLEVHEKVTIGGGTMLVAVDH